MPEKAKNEDLLKSREKRLLYKEEFGQYAMESLLYRDNYFSIYRAHLRINSDENYDISVLDRDFTYSSDIIKQLKIKLETLSWLKEKYPESKIPEGIDLKDIKIDGEPHYHYVRKSLEGATLAEILDKQSKMSPADAFEILKKLRPTIENAHKERLWMHIFDPKNFFIYIDDSGEADILISDIGVNYKFVGKEDVGERLKEFYAPEQRNDDKADVKSDIYSLASLIYFMIKGNIEDYDKAKQVSPFFEKALSLDPESRQNDLDEFFNDFEKFALDHRKSINWQKSIAASTEYRKDEYYFDKEEYKEEFGYGKTGSTLENVAAKATTQTKDELKRRGRMAFMGAVTAVIAVWLSALWEWWYKPKRVLATLGLAIIGVAVAVWYTATNKSGEIAISVREAYGNIPLERIDSVKVLIEAAQNKSDDPMPDIKFFSSDPDQSPERMSITLWTNPDGFAYAKYKGRFDREEVVLKVKVNTHNTKYEMLYNKGEASDTVLNDKELIEVALIPKREMVTDTALISLPPIPAGMLAVYETPPKEYKVDIKVLDINDKPSLIGQFKIYDGKKDEKGKKLIPQGDMFTAEELQFRTSPYILVYTVEDSSKLYYDFTITDPEDFPFDFDSPEAQEVSKKAKEESGGGGGAAAPLAPTIERKDSAAFQYTFEIIDQSGNRINNAYLFIIPSNSDGEENSNRYQISNNGSVIFPEQPFKNLYDFWNQNGNEMELTLKLYFPRNPPGKRYSKPRKFPKKFMETQVIKLKYDEDRNVILF